MRYRGRSRSRSRGRSRGRSKSRRIRGYGSSRGGIRL